MYNYVIIGAGISGASAARILAEKGNKVLILEANDFVGGLCYDKKFENIYYGLFGPHIFHTNDLEIYNFIKRFTDLNKYEHKVMACIKHSLFTLPINQTTILHIFDEYDSKRFIYKIQKYFSTDSVSIKNLIEVQDMELRLLGTYLYKNFFEYYSKKQWGEFYPFLDKAVFERVPIRLSNEDRYFTDKYQGMPQNGFTNMIKCMLDHQNITLKINEKNAIKYDEDTIFIHNKLCKSQIIYTGEIDKLFNYQFGSLSYRSVRFDFQILPNMYFQKVGTINFTQDKKYTRITDFHRLYNVQNDSTVICKEYPYTKTNDNDIPAYPIPSKIEQERYLQYYNKSRKYNNLYLLGRLAEYKYLNIDQAIKHALDLCKSLK